MKILILVIHVLAAAGIIGLVLLQHGKGADMGAAFGSGASGSLFGATGSANFLSRSTALLAVVFFLTSMGLAYLSGQKAERQGVMADQPMQSKPVASPSEVPAPGTEASKAKEIPK